MEHTDDKLLLRKIIQLRETSTDDYLYPITLIEALRDSKGTEFNKILQDKLNDLYNTISDDTEKEISNVMVAVNGKVSSRESLLSTLSVYYLRGTYQLDISEIYDHHGIKLYYLEDKPIDVLNISEVHYWIPSNNRANIQYYNGTDYVPVSEDLAIFLYACMSSYLKDTGHITIYVSTEHPTESPISKSNGDVYIHLDTDVLPYMWMSTRWIPMISSMSTPAEKMSIDAIVNIVSVRNLSLIYTSSEPSSTYDIWYDGTSAMYLHEGAYVYGNPSLDSFIRSIFSGTMVGTTIRLFICPAEPLEATTRDIWINSRDRSIYIYKGTWIRQYSHTNDTYLSIDNIFLNSSDFDSDRWIDYDSNLPTTSTLLPEVIGENRSRSLSNSSITQNVPVSPNTIYTFSAIVSGSGTASIEMTHGEIVSTNVVPISGTEKRVSTSLYFDSGVTTNTSRLVISGTCIVHSLVLQTGMHTIWSPHINDIYTLLFSLLDSHVMQSSVYIGLPHIDSPYNIDVDNSYSAASVYARSQWISISNREGVLSALQEIGSIYEDEGICKITTSHEDPDDPSVGDIWIDDILNAYRWTGSRWGTVSGLLSSQHRKLEGTVQVLSDTQMQLAFVQSVQGLRDDLLTLADTLATSIQIFEQDTDPSTVIGTVINVGDLWMTQTPPLKIYRWNGASWVQSGDSRLLDIEADASGLNVTIGGTSGTLGSRVADLNMSVEEIALTVSDNLDDINQMTSVFAFDGRGLRVSSILDSAESNIGYGSFFIHLRYSAGTIDSSGKPVKYGMSSAPTSRSVSMGIAITSVITAPNNIESYTWVPMDGPLVDKILYVDNIEELSHQITLTRKYSVDDIGTNPTDSSIGTDYIGLSINGGPLEWSIYRNVGSPVYTYYTSDGILFRKTSESGSDVTIGSVTSGGFRLNSGVIENGGFLRMGNFLWRPMIDNSLSFLYSPET